MTTPDYPRAYLYKRIVAAKLFMDSHFSDDIDLLNIADEACFSRFHFIRLFKAIYERTPYQYLMSVRIEAAKKLLQQEHSVSDTCFSVGFDSLSSFSGLFKRYTRQSPTEYSHAYAARQEQIREIPLQFIPACFADQKSWTQKSNFEEVN